jgi:hypothetical protein
MAFDGAFRAKNVECGGTQPVPRLVDENCLGLHHQESRVSQMAQNFTGRSLLEQPSTHGLERSQTLCA